MYEIKTDALMLETTLRISDLSKRLGFELERSSVSPECIVIRLDGAHVFASESLMVIEAFLLGRDSLEE